MVFSPHREFSPINPATDHHGWVFPIPGNIPPFGISPTDDARSFFSEKGTGSRWKAACTPCYGKMPVHGKQKSFSPI